MEWHSMAWDFLCACRMAASGTDANFAFSSYYITLWPVEMRPPVRRKHVTHTYKATRKHGREYSGHGRNENRDACQADPILL